MDIAKKKLFNERMGKRQKLSHGGLVKRQKFATGGVTGALGSAAQGGATGAAVGSIIPGLGTAVGGAVGAVAGFLGNLFGGGGPQMPNITDPVTGAQITDANGRVVASQDQLKSFAQSLQGADGVKNQSLVFNQLQAVTQGKGPNPAAAMLAESTGKNVANQAALAAGQRGASSNVGLIERQNAQQGAQTQQQAVGQGATLQANQALNALNASGGIAAQQVGETQSALNASAETALNNQNQILNAQTAYNNQQVGGQGSVNAGNTSITTAQIPGQTSAISAVPAGIGDYKQSQAALNKPPIQADMMGNMMAEGGLVHKEIPGPHVSHVANYLAMAHGGKVPAMVSPGEISLTPEQVKEVIHDDADPLKIGEKIGGKAKVKGDSEKNDTVPKTLEEGGVIISREHAKNPEKAKLFVHKSVLKHMHKPRSAS
jgi:hypothetical protein